MKKQNLIVIKRTELMVSSKISRAVCTLLYYSRCCFLFLRAPPPPLDVVELAPLLLQLLSPPPPPAATAAAVEAAATLHTLPGAAAFCCLPWSRQFESKSALSPELATAAAFAAAAFAGFGF